MNTTIGRFISKTLCITFRWAISIKDYIIQSEFKGTFTCGGCSYRRYIYTGSSPTLPNRQMFKVWHYANCKTCGVVYLMLCECDSFYVGKTKVEFWRRIYRHGRSIQTCVPDLPLGRHVMMLHGGKFHKIKFLVLVGMHPNPKAEDWNKLLLQRELKWIYLLNAAKFSGLNEAVNYKPFLERFVSGGMKKWTSPWDFNHCPDYIFRFRFSVLCNLWSIFCDLSIGVQCYPPGRQLLCPHFLAQQVIPPSPPFLFFLSFVFLFLFLVLLLVLFLCFFFFCFFFIFFLFYFSLFLSYYFAFWGVWVLDQVSFELCTREAVRLIVLEWMEPFRHPLYRWLLWPYVYAAPPWCGVDYIPPFDSPFPFQCCLTRSGLALVCRQALDVWCKWQHVTHVSRPPGGSRGHRSA